jgi:hypothetical protein
MWSFSTPPERNCPAPQEGQTRFIPVSKGVRCSLESRKSAYGQFCEAEQNQANSSAAEGEDIVEHHGLLCCLVFYYAWDDSSVTTLVFAVLTSKTSLISVWGGMGG